MTTVFKKEDSRLCRRRQLSLENMTVVFGKYDSCLWKIWQSSLEKMTVILIKRKVEWSTLLC